MSNILKNFFQSVFSATIDKVVRAQLTAAETENNFLVGTRRYDESDRDRVNYTREDILDQCLDAWRDSPLGRRIVELTSQYAIGGGFDLQCKHEETKAFIDQFWNHRLNRVDPRLVELCDELTRTGNLFLLISTDPSGMSFIRAIPASDIDSITPSENDIEQPVSFTTKADDQLQAYTYQAFNHLTDAQDQNGSFAPVMLHYAVNRPAGAQWGAHLC
jgi:hypothetical protein